jgi:hypothetical protein
LTVGERAAEGGEPAIIHAKLQLMAALGYGKIVDQIDLALLVGRRFALLAQIV